MARLPPGGSLGTPKILSTGAKLHLAPIRLNVENWECRALKSSARCQTLARENGVVITSSPSFSRPAARAPRQATLFPEQVFSFHFLSFYCTQNIVCETIDLTTSF